MRPLSQSDLPSIRDSQSRVEPARARTILYPSPYIASSPLFPTLQTYRPTGWITGWVMGWVSSFQPLFRPLSLACAEPYPLLSRVNPPRLGSRSDPHTGLLSSPSGDYLTRSSPPPWFTSRCDLRFVPLAGRCIRRSGPVRDSPGTALDPGQRLARAVRTTGQRWRLLLAGGVHALLRQHRPADPRRGR